MDKTQFLIFKKQTHKKKLSTWSERHNFWIFQILQSIDKIIYERRSKNDKS